MEFWSKRGRRRRRNNKKRKKEKKEELHLCQNLETLTWQVGKNLYILTGRTHKSLSRIRSFYFRGQNGGFHRRHVKTTSFEDLSR
jgi:hypothetical protein